MYPRMTPYASPLAASAPPSRPPGVPSPRRTLSRNSSRVRPGASVHVVPTRRSVCASLPATAASRPARPNAGVGNDPLTQPVVLRHHRAVAHFERWHQHQQLQILLERHMLVPEVHEVIEAEEDAGLLQACDHVEHIPAERLNIAMKRLGHAVDAEMHLEAPVRGPARHFLANDDVRRVSGGLEERERTIDAVVIGDGDEVHASRFSRFDTLARASSSSRAHQERRWCRCSASGTCARACRREAPSSQRLQNEDLEACTSRRSGNGRPGNSCRNRPSV